MKLIFFQSVPSFYSIQPLIFIINEKQLDIEQKLTWILARNQLYELALNEEHKQGWHWSCYVFLEDDVHI
jgi:hypothetical protein